MSRNWWTLVARGVFAVLFGLLAIIVPGLTLAILVLMFGAYVLVDGAFNVYAALVGRGNQQHWWIGLLEGVIGVIAGILTFIWPAITGLILLYLIAFWAVLTGILEIMAAFQLRKEISNEWLLGLSGVLSSLFGVLLILSPSSGALAIAWVIGLYAMVFGGLLIWLGFRLRQIAQSAGSARDYFAKNNETNRESL